VADLEVCVEIGRYRIPAAQLEWSFGTSGGPGGQHANKANTRAELRFDLAGSDVFPSDTSSLMLAQLGNRVSNGVVIVSVDESRSQWRNRAIARKRLAEWLADAMKRPTVRKRTKPTRASQRRRVEAKRARSETKRLRRNPSVD
jgi:ribosome-associated protein